MSEEWRLTLKRYRLRHGLSQAQLAQLLVVSQRTVSRWERGEDNPGLEAQKRLRDLGLEPPLAMLASLKATIMHCPAPRALSTKHRLRLLGISKPAIEKRPSMANFIGHDLIKLASGVLQEMLDDIALQSDIARQEVACVVATTRSVLRTQESAGIGTYRTTISYFVHDGTMFSDAISVPAPDDAICGYQAMPVLQVGDQSGW